MTPPPGPDSTDRPDRGGDAVAGGGGGFAAMPLCPACGGDLVGIQCKSVCSRCRVLVENCSGD